MVINKKSARLFRLAPVAASLTALALVAACARTNGRTPISEESADRMVNLAKGTVANYKADSAENMAFAKTLKGATLTVNSRDKATNAIDASIRIVFNDETTDIVAKGTMTGKTKEVEGTLLTSGGPNDRTTMLAHCLNADCQIVIAEIDRNDLVAAQPAAQSVTPPAADANGAQVQDVKGSLSIAANPQAGVGTTSPSDVPSTGNAAVDQAAADQAASAKAAADKAAADKVAADKAAAEQAAKPTMQTVAKAIIIFSVDSIVKKSKKAKTDGDSADSDTVSQEISNTFVIRHSTPTEAGQKSGALISYEDAYQAKYNTAAPSDVDAQIKAMSVSLNPCAKDANGVVTCNFPDAQAAPGTTSPTATVEAGKVGIGTTSPAAVTAPAKK